MPCFLARYQYQIIIYRPGVQNGNADTLSILPPEDTESEEEEEETPEEVILALKTLAGGGPILSRVRNFVLHGWSERRCTEIDLQPYHRRLEPVSPRLRHSPEGEDSPERRGLTIRGMTKAGRDWLESKVRSRIRATGGM